MVSNNALDLLEQSDTFFIGNPDTTAWTSTTEQAWSEAYAAVTQLMLRGADYPAEILIPQ